jgi:NAD(P)-dependent dehydrogenase (short-subunit alcohol dehydrogenase family)
MTNIFQETSFGATSTTDDVLSGLNLKGKRIFVTGASAGIGVETARSLAAHGAQVVGAARDLNKANAATEQMQKDAAANGGSFELVELDLASMKSVRACADRLLAKGGAVRCRHRQRGSDGHTARPHSGWLRNAVRHQSSGPLRPGQPDCVAYPRRWTADQSVFSRPPVFQCRPR